jgi:branched-chain amino acid transport system ATP-binding protein
MSLPQMLMLDEISLGLAPNLVSRLFEAVVEINHGGTTVLLVEQNVLNALNISHRGYVLENGRLVMMGTSKELLEESHIKTAYLGI